MPLTVITLSNAPSSLRGDLTKWMQEIATGVYVGNFNSKVREALWERVLENIGSGNATLSYACRNEIGYNFETWNTQREVIDSEGIPLVFVPRAGETKAQDLLNKGFSKASKYRQARKFSGEKKRKTPESYVVLDIETTGLDEKKDQIIEIGVIKVEGEKKTEFQRLVCIDRLLPEKIVELTGITQQHLDNQGEELKIVIEEFINFIGELPIVGYNTAFDIKFLNKAFHHLGIKTITNRIIDVMPIIKKERKFLDNYKLQTVINCFGIDGKVEHRALPDAKLLALLVEKVNLFESF